MSSDVAALFRYEPAVLVRYASVGVCLEYRVYDDSIGGWRRRRIRLNRHLSRFRTKDERRREAFRLVDEINCRLREGWTPLSTRYDLGVGVVKQLFLDGKRDEGCRDTTLVQYGSVLSLFVRWLEDGGRGNMGCGRIGRGIGVEYSDYCLSLRNRHRSYNNTVKVLKAFFQWAIDHGYARENPFEGVKLLRKERKIRTLIDAENRRRIGEYYDRVCPQMGTVCRLVYSSAVRPVEAWRMRVRDVDLDRHCVCIPDENAKNHRERFATLSADLVERLRPVVEGAECGECFLFGQNDRMLPDVRAKARSFFQKSWERMRRELGLPVEMQLYSLRDTGLVDLLHSGVDQLTVRQHADHSSLAMQDIYTSHFDPDLNRKIYENAPDF